MEPQPGIQKAGNVPAILLGLVIGMVGAGIGAYFFINRPGPDVHSLDFSSASNEQLDRELSKVESSDLELDIKELQKLLQDKSLFERAVALQQVTVGLHPDELTVLFTHADRLRPTSQRDEIQAAVVRQLAQHNPKATLNHLDSLPAVRRKPLIGIVYQEWSVLNLEETIEFARQQSDGNKTAALEGILRSRIDLSENVRRDIAKQLGNEQFILDQWAKSRDQEDIRDPSSEWSDFLTAHGDEIAELSANQRNLLANIARAWIDRDGFGDMVQGMSVSLADFDTSVSLVEFVLESLVADDLSSLVEAAATMSDEVRSIVKYALEHLAETDPRAALEIAVMLEAGSNQVALQRSAIGAWIEADPKAALEARDGLPGIFTAWIEQTALMSMVRTLPEEVPQFIPTISDETQMEIVVINLGLNWARKDPMAVFEWLQSEPEAKPWYEHVLSNVIENLTKQDFEEAMRFALELPPREYDGVGWEAVVIWSIAHRDIDAGLELIDHARDEKTRDYMMRSIGQVFIQRAQFERAMEWAESLKTAQREEYYQNVVMGWAVGKPEQLFQNIESLPTDKLRENAAHLLISLNQHKKAFSEEQIEELRKHLPAEESDAQ